MGLNRIREVAKGDIAVKAGKLLEILGGLESALVAFSGGVDSSLLLAAAFEALHGNLLAVTASSPTYPRRELENARQIARLIGCEHLIIKTHEIDDPNFRQNPIERCYHCKRTLFALLKVMAEKRGLKAVIEGSTSEDLGDFRPGERALVELGVQSPLRQADFMKDDVRTLAHLIGLPNWNQPPRACLASRFPYGVEITQEALGKIERIEESLYELGFAQVRARYHGDLIRIEVESNSIERALDREIREKIVQIVKREGFRFVTLDLQGYRTGVFNPT